MIANLLWGYLCMAGFASVLVYCACLAAARADRIRRSAPIKFIKSAHESTRDEALGRCHPSAKVAKLLVIERHR